MVLSLNLAYFIQFVHISFMTKYFRVSLYNAILFHSSCTWHQPAGGFIAGYQIFNETRGFRLLILRNDCHSLPSVAHSPSDSVISERQLLSGVQNVPRIVPCCCTATYGSPQFTYCQFHLSDAARWLMAQRQGHSVLPLPKGCYILVCMVVRVHLADKSTFKPSSPTGTIFQVNFSSCVTLSPWLWQPGLLDFS